MRDLSNVPKRFQWTDKSDRVWNVDVVLDSQTDITWHVGPGGPMVAHSHAYVQIQDNFNLRYSATAYLMDIKVNCRNENQGIGSMLVRDIIKECKQLGFDGIYGYLSYADRDHFDKLDYFYKKLGFSVVFYPPGHPGYGTARTGKVEMIF